MLTKDHEVTTNGEQTTVHAEMNLLGTLALAKFIRSMPENQRAFFKECRIAAVIPAYLPSGDFESSHCAVRMDPEEIEWFLKRRPEFRTVDETGNNTLSTGRRICMN